MALRFWYIVTGYVRMRITGAMPERLINLCLSRGIPLWNLIWQGGGIEANITPRQFLRLRPLVRRAGVKIKLLDRRGLPFVLRRVRRRRLAFAAVLVLTAGLFMFSSFIWFVEVRGPMEALTADELTEVLSDLGLRPGVSRFSIDRHEISRQVILRLPAVAWANVTFLGTKAVVEVVERTLPPDEPLLRDPGHLVASRTGLIADILVLTGEGQVQEGDTVRAGDLLISGRLGAPAPQTQFPVPGADPPPAERFKWVRAQGRVMAQTWYEGYIEVPLVERYTVRTGRLVARRLVRLAGREIRLTGPRDIPYRDFEVERIRQRPGSRVGVATPLELVIIQYFEIQHHERSLTKNEAQALAESRLQDRLLGRIAPQARIVGVEVDTIHETDGYIGVRMLVEAVENIGTFKAAARDELEAAPEWEQDDGAEESAEEAAPETPPQ